MAGPNQSSSVDLSKLKSADPNEIRIPSDLAQNLAEITGLAVRGRSASTMNATASAYYEVTIPEGADRNKFLDKFAELRNAAGISKQELGIADVQPGQGRTSPEKFYLVPGDKNPNAAEMMQQLDSFVERLSTQKSEFKDLAANPPTAAAPTHQSRPSGP